LGVDSQGRTTYGVECPDTEGETTTPLTGRTRRILSTSVGRRKVQILSHLGHLGRGFRPYIFTISHTAASETVIAGFDCRWSSTSCRQQLRASPHPLLLGPQTNPLAHRREYQHPFVAHWRALSWWHIGCFKYP
jgi:hypothetical protein